MFYLVMLGRVRCCGVHLYCGVRLKVLRWKECTTVGFGLARLG